MARTKKNLSNNTQLPETRKRTWADCIKNSSFELFPGKDDWRQRFVNDMYEWAQKDDSLEIQQFTMKMCMRRQTLYEWANQYPEIKEALCEVRLILASRRRIGALKKDFDKEVVFKDLHKLDPEWLEINKYHADLKTQEAHHNKVEFVLIGKPEVQSAQDLEKQNNIGE